MKNAFESKPESHQAFHSSAKWKAVFASIAGTIRSLVVDSLTGLFQTCRANEQRQGFIICGGSTERLTDRQRSDETTTPDNAYDTS
eukprot:762911-Hanusia_phi.AAC.3